MQTVIFKQSDGSDESLQEADEGAKGAEGCKKLTFVPDLHRCSVRNGESCTQQAPEL